MCPKLHAILFEMFNKIVYGKYLILMKVMADCNVLTF